jgi:hypothetical protein
MDANFSVRIDLGYGMNWFLEKVEFSSPCLVPSLYCSVSDLKCVTIHKISRGSPRPLLTRGINMVTLSPISIGRKIWLLLDIIRSACFDKLLPLAIHSLWMWFDLVQRSHVYLSCSFVWNRELHIVHSCSQSIDTGISFELLSSTELTLLFVLLGAFRAHHT